jgi:hypothetical protein
MNNIIEKTAKDVYNSMMELEASISINKKLIRENNLDDKLALQFSADIFNLFVKRVKHGFFLKGEFEKGYKLEQLLNQNEEAIGHTITANAMKVLMNTMMYDINPDDTFMEILKDYSEYLKPILLKVI